MECVGCKKEIDENNNFCPNCGLKIEKERNDLKKLIKELLGDDKAVKFNQELSKLDDEKDSKLIIENSTTAINVFSIKNIPLYFLRSMSYMCEEKYDLSLQDLTNIIDISTNVCADKFLVALLQLIEDNYSMIQIITRSYNLRGMIYVVKENYDLAIKDFDEYRNLISNDNIKNMFIEDIIKEDMFYNYYYNGLACINKEDIDNAKVLLEKAIKIEPNNNAVNELYEQISKGGSYGQVMNTIKSYGTEFIKSIFKEFTKQENIDRMKGRVAKEVVSGIIGSFFED